MRFLSTRTHAILDYVLGVFLIAAPWVLGFAIDGPETWVPVAAGIAVVGYGLLTDYELGVRRKIAVATHLWLDALVGAVLASSPILFGFAPIVWVPHVVVGVALLAIALVTMLRPARRFWPAG